MAYNKFITKDETVLLDLTTDTVTTQDVRQGVKFHGNDGKTYTGTMEEQIGIAKTEINANGELVATDSNGMSKNLGKVVGADGQDGKDGLNGIDGKTPYIENDFWYIDGVSTGIKANGKDGKDGEDGEDGKSAYEYAKIGGYTGTESDFTNTLANILRKQDITLGVHTDGLLYLFIDGEPTGTGVELGVDTGAHIIGYVDNGNNIILTGALEIGTYTCKYENEDGTYTEIGSIEIGEEEIIINLVHTSLAIDGDGIYNDVGYKDGTYISMDSGESQPSKDGQDASTVATGFIPYTFNTLYIKGVTLDANTSHCRAQYISENYTVLYQMATGSTPWTTMFTIETLGDNYYKLTPKQKYENVKYVRFSLLGKGADLIISTNEIV